MAKSSIHFESGSRHFLFHNDRTNPTKNAVFFDEKNETLNTGEMAAKLFDDELKIRSAKYTERTGQKLQKNATTHLSSIINLEQHHTLDDVKKIADKMAKILDTKILQISIHRDEGKLVAGQVILTSGIDFFYNPKDDNYYLNKELTKLFPKAQFERFTKEKNYHAHIEMMGLDSNGISLRQNVFIEKDGKKVKKRERLDKSFYSKIQTFVADTLGMERGVINKGRARKHIQTQDYKQGKAVANKENKVNVVENDRKNKVLRAKIKDLDIEVLLLKGELQEQGAGRKQYAQLEQLNRDLKDRIKSKDLTIEDMREQLKTLHNALINTPTQAHAMGNVGALTELGENDENAKIALEQIEKSAQEKAGEVLAEVAISKIFKPKLDGKEFKMTLGTEDTSMFSEYNRGYKHDRLLKIAKSKFSDLSNRINSVSLDVVVMFRVLQRFFKPQEKGFRVDTDPFKEEHKIMEKFQREISLEKDKIDNFGDEELKNELLITR